MDVTETSRSQEEILRQLQEKDQLVQTLTERLGEVAEQLDRARRSGSAKRGRASGASSEMLEQQRQLIENLSAVTEQWGDVQPRDAFGRLEARLDHMRTLLESAIGSGLAPGELLPEAAEPRVEPAEPNGTPPQYSDAQEDNETAEELLSGWEAMKAQLLSGNSGASETPVGTAPQAIDDPPALEDAPGDDTTDAPAAEPPVSPGDPVSLGDDVELPQPVDFESVGREQLEHAIDVRDQFIGFLTRRLRSEQHRTREATNWEELNNAPEELRERLQNLEADLEDRLRIAEVELSLERARLSRVQSRTEEMQRQIEARLRSNRKAKLAKPSEDAESDSSDDPTSAKSWFSNLRRR